MKGHAGLTLMTCLLLAGCQSLWSFEPRAYFDPLTAGVRDANVSALAFGRADRFDFQVEPTSTRQVWDIDLGFELPLMGWESLPAVNGRVAPGALGLGFWIPIDFHMIEDFEDDSNPIINTDYRFGAMTKLQYGLSPVSHLATRLFLGHESTHLGDEFSLAGQRAFPNSFERINVSWEYLDAALQYEHAHTRGFWCVRVGLTTTIPFGDSYYSVDPNSATESAVGPVIESRNSLDPYLGFEYERNPLQLKASGPLTQWGGYLSMEIRYRSIYDYHRADANVAEERTPSINVIAGIQKVSGRFDRVSPFLRFYHGVNPHGQFRNQSGYTQYGVGLRLQR